MTALQTQFEVAAHAQLLRDRRALGVEAVRAYFERRGFQMGGVKPEAYEGLSPGVILRQYPLAGHPVTRSDVISLVVSISADEMSPETR